MLAEKVHIRTAIPFDRHAILHVNRVTWQEAYQHIYTEAEIKGLFNNSLSQNGTWVYRRDERLGMLVAEINQQIVGFIGMGSLLNDTSAEITTFYILPRYQSDGIGTLLWQRAMTQLQEAGYSGVWVWVLGRASARKFYEAQGCIERERGQYTIGIHSEVAIGYWSKI